MSKQVIVVRKDLKMNYGKTAAQVSHASMGAILQLHHIEENYSDIDGHLMDVNLVIPLYSVPIMGDPGLDRLRIRDWLTNSFTKICLKVNSEEELLDIRDKVKGAGLLHSLITDEGRTCFNGVPTHTCLGIGPDDDDKINEITGHLSLL